MKTLAESSFRNEQYQQPAGTAIVEHIFGENQTSNMMQSAFSVGISRFSHDVDDDDVERFSINSNEISRETLHSAALNK